ncbi:MAG: hypothetical protein MI799_01655 [Desulfobacterales bacterium]|nr:hypothetical protein [Desulfobacterales bacterium]
MLIPASCTSVTLFQVLCIGERPGPAIPKSAMGFYAGSGASGNSTATKKRRVFLLVYPVGSTLLAGSLKYLAAVTAAFAFACPARGRWLIFKSRAKKRMGHRGDVY